MPAESTLKIEFDRLYDSQILPNIENLEAYRLRKKRLFDALGWITLIGILASVIIFILACMQKLPSKFALYGLIGFFGTMLIFLPILNKISDDLRAMLKDVYLTPILELFGLKRSEFEEISLDEIKNFGLFPRAHRKTDDDNIVGTYNGIPLVLTETKLTHSVSSGKSGSRTITDFSGLIFKIKLNKRFSGILVGNKKIDFADIENLARTAVRENPEMFPPEYLEFFNTPIFKMFVMGGNTINNLSDKFDFSGSGIKINISGFVNTNRITRNLEQIYLEDPEFNKEFTLFSDNQVEARYVMTPTFMERLKNLQKYFIFTGLDFAVKDNYFYLFLTDMSTIETLWQQPQGGFFEVGDLNTSLLDKKLFFKVFKELSQILSFISSLRSDGNTDL